MIPRRVGAAAARGGGPGPPAWVTYCAAYTGQFCVAFLRLLYSPLRISIFPVGVATSRVFLFSVLLLACGLWGNKRSTRGSLCPAPPRSPTGATGCHAPRALVSRPLSRHGFLSSALGFSGSPLLVPLRSAVAALGGKFTYLLTAPLWRRTFSRSVASLSHTRTSAGLYCSLGHGVSSSLHLSRTS